MGDFPVTGKRVLVVGAGRSGVAAAQLLLAKGAKVTVADVKPELPEAVCQQLAGATIELGPHQPRAFAAADLIVLSPGVPRDEAAVKAARRAGVTVVGELELASRFLRGPVIAVTGTKGKSTTVTLIGRMLEAAGMTTAVGGNIGRALSLQALASTPDTLHVVEASSFQLETVETFHPWIAVFLNFSPDHLDRHASVEEYRDAKRRIFAEQTDRDWAVVNADDPQVVEMARKGRARQLPFALDTPLAEGVVTSGDRIVHRTPAGDVPLIPVASVRLQGRHLMADVLAAASAARVAGVPPEGMAVAVGSFTGLEHALERVAEIDGVWFFNDSKATNVEAARCSVESFAGGLVPIVGGRFKGGDLRLLREPLAGRARAVVTIGEARALVREAVGDLVPIREAASMAEAVRTAFDAARPDGTVLLAPACASFDMFVDYAERGRVFKQEVARLAEERREKRER